MHGIEPGYREVQLPNDRQHVIRKLCLVASTRMKLPSPLLLRPWLLVLILVLCFTGWINHARIQRVEYVTRVGQAARVETGSTLTGYAAGTRELIVPEHIEKSYGWIAQTQQMLAHREWRVRHLGYENSPAGRVLHSASPYRWWLGFVAQLNHWVTGNPLGVAVERAALYADPALHALLLVITTLAVARLFGVWPAAMAALGGATLFPFAAGFLPGVPDDFTLGLIAAPWCVLPLLVGIRALPSVSARPEKAARNVSSPEPFARSTQRWFLIGGIIGGLGLWINVSHQWPLLLGIALGGLMAAWAQRRSNDASLRLSVGLTHWRAWSLGGAATILVAYLLEYFPAYLGQWEMRAIHPLYAIAWLGVGEMIGRMVEWIQGGKLARRPSDLGLLTLAIAATAALPILAWKTKMPRFSGIEMLTYRLTRQADGIMAPHLKAWLANDGFTWALGATLLPLLFLGIAGWLMVRRKTPTPHRVSLALALGPVFVALGFACAYLQWWQLLGAVLLPVLVVSTATVIGDGTNQIRRWLWVGWVTLVLVPGVIRLIPARDGEKNTITPSDAESLVERDLSQWLALHCGAEGGPVIYAPPAQTASLCFYGGFRGLGTLAWENVEGLQASLRIIAAGTWEEAHLLLLQRGVTHIVLPSWDNFFEAYMDKRSTQSRGLVLSSVERWALPPWLRPMPYRLPSIAGFETQSVTVLELVEPQSAPVAASCLIEYFIEMGQLEFAKIAAKEARLYAADLGILVARGQLEFALKDPAFTGTVDSVQQRLTAGADRSLPWDRRVSLAILLARAKRNDLARAQVQRCLSGLTEKRLYALTANSLYFLLVLQKDFGLEISDPHMRDRALALLPDDLRETLHRER